jgi:hypothetical protein
MLLTANLYDCKIAAYLLNPLKSDYEILLASRMVMGRVPDMFNGYLEKNIENNNVKS